MIKLFKRKSKLEKFYSRNEEFIKYTIVSTVCTVILYALYFFITWISNGRYIVANFIAYAVSFTVLFIWDQKLFKSRPHRKAKRLYQLFMFILFRVIGFIIDSAILVLLIEKFGIPNYVSKIMSSLITFMFNYITNKLFVFRKANI